MRAALERGYSDALSSYGLEKIAINWRGLATGARNLAIGEEGAAGRFWNELKGNQLFAPGGSLRNQLELRHSTTGPIDPKTNKPAWQPGNFNKGNILNHLLTVGMGASQIMGAGRGQMGSVVGGTLGSTVGGILGTPFGMAGQMVGGTLGGMAGEGLGSIFNHPAPKLPIAGPMAPNKMPLGTPASWMPAMRPQAPMPPSLSSEMSRVTGRPV